MSKQATNHHAYIKTYQVPQSLSDLEGPSTGMIQLPKHLLWIPGERIFDLATTAGVRIVYEAVLSEGSQEELKHYLNGQMLMDRWHELKLPRSLVFQWESQFPCLTGNRFSIAQ